jgi:hypothetical protein
MKVCSLICALTATVFVAGCGSSGGTNPNGCTAVTMGAEGKSVANTLLVPQKKADYAMDLNGDAKLDNQLGNIIGALASQGLNPQDSVNKSLMDGSVVLLLDAKADSLTESSCGSVVVQPGMQTAAPPKYDGTDTFTPDPAIGSGTFKGVISGSKFNSNSPLMGDTVMTVQLPLVSGAAPIALTIHGAHIQFTRGTGATEPLNNGQINGAIKATDVQMSIIPAVAGLLTQNVANGGASAAQILMIFDTGGGTDGSTCATTKDCNGQPTGTPACKNPGFGPRANTCADACDNTIDTCEVANNSIIKNVLAPDIQMFAADGQTYMPNKDNTMKDSLSLGLSFTGVKASF